MTANARVQQHRVKVQAQQRRRLEVSIGIPVIDKVRQIACWIHKPVWSAVQDALARYVNDFDTLVIEGERLGHERARLLGQPDSLVHRHQIDEYNRQLILFNERLGTFRQRPAFVLGPMNTRDVTGYEGR